MKDITNTVREVLIAHKDARDSDFHTYGWVIKKTNPELLGMKLGKVLWEHKELDVPSFETIRRARQKIQHDCPELRGAVYEKRMSKQAEYIDEFVKGA